jgi:hypothetical protein
MNKLYISLDFILLPLGRLIKSSLVPNVSLSQALPEFAW